MSTIRRSICALAATMLVSVMLAPRELNGQDATHPKADESHLRKAALTSLPPVIPVNFTKDCREGVAVATVWVDAAGNVSDVQIETAPSPSTGASMVDALRQWRFMTGQEMNEPTGYMGKITYYFLEVDGHPRVLDPFKDKFFWNGTTTWCNHIKQ